MRISSISIYENNSKYMMDKLSELQDASERLNTQKRVITPSDDPIAVAQALLIKQADARNDQFQAARSGADMALKSQEEVLKDVTNTITQIKEKLVAVNNGTLSDADRKALKTELTNLKEQLFSKANARDNNGNYIFAGYQNDKAPFVMDKNGQVVYRGGTDAITIKVDSSRNMPISHTGKDVFLTGANVKNADGSPAESDVFKSIDTALAALDTDLNGAPKDVQDKFLAEISNAARGMENALENTSRVRSEGGSMLAELEQLTQLGESVGVDNLLQIESLENVDLYTAISEFFQLKASLQVSQSAFTYMQNMALFQMK